MIVDLRQKMLDMLDSTRVEEGYEITGGVLIAVSLAAMNKSNVYIWAENDLHTYVSLFKSWGLNVHKVVCSLPKNFQKVDDVEIISPKDLTKDKTPRKSFFLFMPDCVLGKPKNYLVEQLDKIPSVELPNFTYVVEGNDKLTMISHTNEKFDANSMYYYQSHKREIMELFDSLADETSKRALYYYVESYVRNCVYRGEHNPTRYKYFFGGKYERLYKHLDGECWINCGANIGDTVFSYFSWNFKPKKIYAFEGEKQIYDQMLRNLSFLPAKQRVLVEPISEFINERTDFKKILAGNKCTLLNADIEGAELPMLHAMKNIIQADRPVIAICVYHLKEDLLTVPQFLQSICPNYVFYFRKYTPFIGRFKKNGELVFYAVPIERSMLPTMPPPRIILKIKIFYGKFLYRSRIFSTTNFFYANLKGVRIKIPNS